MKYAEAVRMIKTAGRWDGGMRALIGKQLWSNLRAKFPALPKDPLKGQGNKTILPVRFTNGVGYSDAMNQSRSLVQRNGNNYANIKGVMRPRFGAGAYRPVYNGFDYINKAGRQFYIDVANTPINRNAVNMVDQNGMSIYRQLVGNPGGERFAMVATEAAPDLTGDPNWWAKRVPWRDKVGRHMYHAAPPEYNLATRKPTIVANAPVRIGNDIVNNTNVYDHRSDVVGLWPTIDRTSQEVLDDLRRGAGNRGFTIYRHGIASQPSQRFSHTYKGQNSTSQIDASSLDHTAYGMDMPPATMQHELTHAMQNGQPGPDFQLFSYRPDATASIMGIDTYAVSPAEAQQAGLAYKMAVQAARQLSDEERVKLFGEQAARVKAMSPFATGDRKFYRDLEFLRQHPEVAMQLGSETARLVSRYAHLKQLKWDINRRLGLMKKVNGPTAEAIDKANDFVLSVLLDDGSYESMKAADALGKPDAGSLRYLNKILESKGRALQHGYDALEKEKQAIDRLYPLFFSQHKLASGKAN